MQDSPQSSLSEEYQKILEEVEHLRAQKNADYGNSFFETYQEFGIMGVRMDLGRKMQRLKTFSETGQFSVKDESMDDLLKDIANLAMNALVWWRHKDDK